MPLRLQSSPLQGGNPITPVHRRMYERDLVALCGAITQEELEAVWKEGYR